MRLLPVSALLLFVCAAFPSEELRARSPAEEGCALPPEKKEPISLLALASAGLTDRCGRIYSETCGKDPSGVYLDSTGFSRFFDQPGAIRRFVEANRGEFVRGAREILKAREGAGTLVETLKALGLGCGNQPGEPCLAEASRKLAEVLMFDLSSHQAGTLDPNTDFTRLEILAIDKPYWDARSALLERLRKASDPGTDPSSMMRFSPRCERRFWPW
jgi:hypothetical protein